VRLESSGPSVSPHRSVSATGGHWFGRLWRRLLFVCLLLLVAGVAIGARLLGSLPVPEPARSDETSIVLDRHGTPIAYLHAEENRIPVGLEEIAPVMIDAVVASEDRDFFRHPGVDPVAIGRAAWVDIRQEGQLQGGSTITQQYVKNAMLDSDRTLVRKVREAFLAIRLERELTKEEILERYLNVVYFGRGAYGVEAAAQVWFGRSATDLDIAQAAYLAALIRAPELADVSRPLQSGLAHRRRDDVLAAMFEEGYITEAEFRAGRTVTLQEITLPRVANDSVQVLVEGAGLAHPVEAVRRELVDRYGSARVFAGGLRVTTTIDLDAQRIAVRAARSVTDVEGSPEVAVVVLDDQGHVRAMVGGSDFETSQVNLAMGLDGGGGGRQPGSIVKPLVMVAALGQGYSPDSLLASPATLVVPAADGGPDWVVEDAGGVDHGSLALSDAVVVSSNTAFASLATAVDVQGIVDVIAVMGVTAPLRPYPSVVLGAQESSVLDMATAYATLASGGELHRPTMVIAVTDEAGSFEDRSSVQGEQVLPSDHAQAVASTLRRVIAEGTGAAARVPGLDLGGKTGTSQDNRDAWFVGFSPRFTVGVWVGYPDAATSMSEGWQGRPVTGGSIPAELFRGIMSGLHDLTPASSPDVLEGG